MKVCLSLIIGFSVLCTTAFGQSPGRENYVGIRAGYLRASSQFTLLPYKIQQNNVAPRSSYYGGIFYHHNLTSWLAYRVELNYQQKGQTRRNLDGSVADQRPFNYVGVTPLIGLTPLPGLGIFIGPEANVRMNRILTDDSYKAPPIETGVSSRLTYRYKWAGLEVGYFQAFNSYSTLYLPEGQYNYKNYTWHIGLFFVPAKLKK